MTEEMNELEQLRSDFDWFRDQCMKLRNLFNTYLILYSDDDTQNLLKESAGLFFDDLYHWMKEVYYLQVGRLTDPVEMMSYKNLSIATIVKHLRAANIITDSIEKCAKELGAYGKLTKNARNKLYAHSDLETYRSKATLSSHSEQEMGMFFTNLQRFTDEVGIALGVGPLDYSTQAGEGDVVDLIRLLKQSGKSKSRS